MEKVDSRISAYPVGPGSFIDLGFYIVPKQEIANHIGHRLQNRAEIMRYKVLIIASIIVVAGGTFIFGRSVFNQSPGYPGLADLSLANNQLINRFVSEAPEKTVKPTGAVKLSNDTGLYSVLSPDKNNLLFYEPQTGQIHSINIAASLEGNVIGSTPAYQLKPGLTALIWSNDRNEIIAKGPKGPVYYDLKNNKAKDLDAGISQIVFKNGPSAPGDADIAYMSVSPDTGVGSIFILNVSTGDKRKIFNIQTDGWQMSWPTQDKLGLMINGDLFLLDIASGGLERIGQKYPADGVSWSPNGKKLIYSSQSKLYFLDITSGNETLLDAPAKSSDCIWGTLGAVYCATVDSFISFSSLDKAPAPTDVAINPFGPASTELGVNSAAGYLVLREATSNKFYGIYFTQ